MIQQLIVDIPVPLKCQNCGSTAQIKLKHSEVFGCKTSNEYECGCGAKIVVNASITSVEYWSEGPNRTLLKRI